MIKQRVWDCPRLCRCLVSTCMLFSCKVKQQVNSADVGIGLPVSDDGWKVDVWLHVDNAPWNLSVNDQMILAPYAVKKITNGNNRPEILI